jgi:Ca2+-transporting ATPase
MSTVDTSPDTAGTTPWYTQDPDAVVAALGSDRDRGLTAADAAQRLAEHGPNAIAAEKPPSTWQVALQQLADPMNVMLVAVAIISLFINQVSVGILVGALVVLNIVLGTRQELKAKASVDALAKMQIPQAKVVRDGTLIQVDATTLVPGDIVNLEAGDLVPADGRIVRSATLETQEAALTGESAPIPKDAGTLTDPETTLGDRTDMVFQNTQVTRGTAAVVVTGTGMQTQMGQIASMLSAVKPAKSPLQRELDALTGVLGWIAWGAVAVIIVTGLLRGQEIASVILLGISMAISAIPTGMPSFVQAMLSYGSRQLAEHKAVV